LKRRKIPPKRNSFRVKPTRESGDNLSSIAARH